MKALLREKYFSEDESEFIRNDNLTASLFKYKTGICAVRLTNKRGYIIVLPYNGQMVWEARFDDRNLEMKSTYPEPRNVDFFIDTYGCFLMHCGVLAMGCPSPEDNHLTHGEIPYAKYDNAAIVTAEDDKGCYIAVTGEYIYNRAFGSHYVFRPEIRMYSDSSVLDLTVEIENLSDYQMEMMYLCHINIRPTPNSRIVQCLPWDKEHMELRYCIPPLVKIGEEFESLLGKIDNDIRITEYIREDDVYDPEVVLFLKSPKTDDDENTHFILVHSDGTSDYVSYKPKELDHCSRWIARNKNMEALGLALPATADAEGYLAEKKKGNIKILPPKGKFTTRIRMGSLRKEETMKMEEKIINIITIIGD